MLEMQNSMNKSNEPPRHGPNATAQTNGWTGNLIFSSSAIATTIFIIIAVTGIESTNDDNNPDN